MWAVIAFFEGLKTDFHGDFTGFWVFTLVTLASTLTYTVFCIVAAVFARKGRLYYFPVAGRWAFYRVFVVGSRTKAEPRNAPPKGF